ncbi:hypothetical protein JZ751_002763 [Albula glossodonta]|uniref:Uncharacterized protein n=1 Tax=Albula glossodonta TaxID=121402 RepID=A0A8T2N910_9TELE|nr:hypothetical protein JZ751_002763 [Albula glossodonta]
MMTSLVAYEDSDSEDEPVNDKETRHLYARSDSEAGQSRGGQTQFGLSFCNQNNRQTVDNPYDGGQPKARTSSISSGGFIPHLISQTVSFQSSTRAAQSSSECSIAVKRPQPTTVVVRPYIPKRQRLARLEEGGVTESPQGGTPLDQAANTKLLTEVSDCVLPYLGRRSSQAELPRRVRLRVQAHQGPINTVQWCPVPHLSHLLLTASMDGSVKDGIAFLQMELSHYTHPNSPSSEFFTSKMSCLSLRCKLRWRGDEQPLTAAH